jgi:HAD superfamily hydrolase (TIGR01509 family)
VTVVFDLDGVLIDSEARWDEAREGVAREHGGRYGPDATTAMMGMSAPEWSRYMGSELGVPLAPEEINRLVVERMLAGYDRGVPWLPGAREAVERLAAGAGPLGLASSANREVIDRVLELGGLAGHFAATVSSEEVARGKPAPDVYLEAARRLGADPGACAAVEDSANGIRSAVAAGMRTIALPNPRFPPPGEVLASAAVVIAGLDQLTVELVRPPSG